MAPKIIGVDRSSVMHSLNVVKSY